ncbi:hypothetical protein BT93_G1627 [Corymbia citriodora subsp. variegata]|nr:hypothetical protein BT93_G1627 [Corymbia citriodora subsp. variegata]
MANKSVSLVIIFFCILLGSHCLLSRSSAARILTDDDRNKIGAVGSTPKRDGSWNGNSSPSGNVLLSPPTVVKIITMAPPMTVFAASNGTNSHQSPRQHP